MITIIIKLLYDMFRSAKWETKIGIHSANSQTFRFYELCNPTFVVRLGDDNWEEKCALGEKKFAHLLIHIC